MDSGIRSLVSSAKAIEKRVETVANNLANSSTVGYKSDELSFREILSQSTSIPVQSPEESFNSHENLDFYVGLKQSTVTSDEVGKNFAQGVMKFTDNTLDLGIETDGFFTVETPQGERFTRAGNFTLDHQGYVTTEAGDQVMGQKGAIKVEGTDIIVDEEGNVHVDGKYLDTLKLVEFKDLNRLQKLGNNFFAPVDQDNVPIVSKEVRVKQGVLEGSNVNTVKEMTRMIEANRSYETVQKVLSNIDKMNEKSISIAKV